MISREVNWEVTNSCNLKCKHCISSSGKPRPNELNTEESIKAVRRLHLNGVDTIYFTGGEPFWRPDFLSIIKEASLLGIRSKVITNATLLDRTTAEFLKKRDVKLAISLDGSTAPINDAVRGKGVFKKTIEAIETCLSKEIPFSIYTVINQNNTDDLEALSRFAKDCDCEDINFKEITIAGRAIKFAKELIIPPSEKRGLPKAISTISREVFGEKLSAPDQKCWLGKRAPLYMTSDGNFYPCSEIGQNNPRVATGNVKLFLPKGNLFANNPGSRNCCFTAQGGNRITFVRNNSLSCAHLPDQKHRIKDLQQLYVELDKLYCDINSYCKKCNEVDCVGYLWLLESEATNLYERGVEILEVNGKINFLNPFLTEKIDIERFQPRCPWLNRNRCTIRNERPFVCRLYPLSLAIENGIILVVLNVSCLFSKKIGVSAEFRQKTFQIFKNMDPGLFEDILRVFEYSSEISKFPRGRNQYVRLFPLENTKGVKYVQMQSRS